MAHVNHVTVVERFKHLRLIQPRQLQATGPERGVMFTKTDLVHHAGKSATGMCVHTLQLVDLGSGWSDRVAVPARP